ncbi:MAG: hypothetical protein E5Y74_27200 [Mesorhizobium sp.]|nr:MAG: hypothetical protein E5Y74_27200 [Mesorhizobium sp.]
MDADTQTTRRLNMLIEQHVEVRKSATMSSRSVRAGKAIKTVLRECPVTGKALDDMIAASAVAHGLGVVFDNQGT